MDRTALIERYRTGMDDLAEALRGTTDEDLDRAQEGGEWTARQVVHHLADGEAMSYTRLCRLVADDPVVIQGYDEPGFAERLHYDRAIETSLAIVGAVRAGALSLMTTMTDADWSLPAMTSSSARRDGFATSTRWPGHVTAMRRAGLVLLLAVVLAACAAPTPSRLFQTDLRPGEDPSYPVVLSDETGLVTSIDPAPVTPGFDYGAPAVRADPTDPNAFILSWGGGPGSDAALFFKQFEDGYLLRLEAHTRSGFPGGGGDGALHLHDVRIVTSTPIPIESIVAGGSPT